MLSVNSASVFRACILCVDNELVLNLTTNEKQWLQFEKADCGEKKKEKRGCCVTMIDCHIPFRTFLHYHTANE